MHSKLAGITLFSSSLLATAQGGAQTAALLAVADATQLSEVQLAKVMADDSTLWLSVRLQGRTRLALVTAEAGVESAPAADAWLRALDAATRVRVAAPSGPLSGCGANQQLELADSGLPEPRIVSALEVSSASSELELRRLLADAGLPVDVERVAHFTSEARAPFRVAIYDVPAFGGSTEALRLIDRGYPDQLPRVDLSGASSVPLSLIALAKDGVLPLQQDGADPSELSVTYRALDTTSDYLSARRDWLARNPTRWLNEVQASDALFAWTVFPVNGQLAPAVSRYFAALSAMPAGSCDAQVRAAHARASVNAADYVCGGADDLSRSLLDVGFADLRLSRFFGTASADGASFRVAPSVLRSPLLVATDLDQSGCPTAVLPPANAGSESPDARTPLPVNTSPVVVSAPEDRYYDPAPVATPGSGSSGSWTVTTSSNDSCSGDSSSSDSQRDSCSGDSSSSNSSGDSCSGDSSSSDSSSSNSSGDSCSGDSSASESEPESCSGDSSASDSEPESCSGDTSDSSASDSSGDSCSGSSDSSSDDSGSGGDTCSGTGSSNGSTAARPRPRQVRLSLLTLLAAALALPLRRLRASR